MSSKFRKKDLYISDRLMAKIARYDARAFEQLYETTSGAVFGLAMSMLQNKDDASDVVQNTFITIYEKIKQYSPNGKAMAWIFTIARNHALQIIREKKKHDHTDLDDVYDVGVDSTIDEDLHKERLVDKLLLELDEEDRQIVVMHAMSNMKHKDIAQIMEMPISTVLSKYRRAIKKLKNYMEVNEYEKERY